MTVIGTSNRTEHEGNGILTTFPYNFRVDLLAHMTVFVAGEEVVSGWSITGLGSPTGGDIIFDDAPLDGDLIVFLRVVPITQGMDYQPYDPFPAESHEHALDWLTFICQQLQEELNRKYGSPPGGGEGGDFIMPEPEAGKVLAWREDELGLENQPGIGTFIELVERSEEAAATAVASSGWAFLWAQEEIDVPVNDGIHPPGYSAYHWASKAEEGGIIDIFSEDEQMMVVNIPEPRYRSLEMLTGTPGAMIKLDHQGLVPLENMPFTGNLRFIHLYEGHDRCPKFQYEVPDETPCVDPDYRNPSERVPSIDWDGGDYFVIVQCDEEPLLNRVNLINPATGEYEITDVANGDAILWLEGDEGLAEPGWYLYPGFATDSVLAENVIFDDTNTDIKGITVQEWNQAADAVIQDKVDQSGDLMTGNLDFMNDIGVRGYENDALTLIDLIKLDSNDHVHISGSVDHDGDTILHAGAGEFIRLNQGNEQVQIPRHTRFNRAVQLLWRNIADDADMELISVTTANAIDIGGIGNHPVAALVTIHQGSTPAVVITQTEITFLRAISFDGDINLGSDSSLNIRNAADTEDIVTVRRTTDDSIQLGGIINQLHLDALVEIFHRTTVAISIAPQTITFTKDLALDHDIKLGNGNYLMGRNAANTADIIMAYVTGDNDVWIGGGPAQPSASDCIIAQGGGSAITITDALITFEKPTAPPRSEQLNLSGLENVNLGNSDRIRITLTGSVVFSFINVPTTGQKKFVVETNGHTANLPAGTLWESGVTPLMDSGVWVVDLIIDDGMILASASSYS